MAGRHDEPTPSTHPEPKLTRLPSDDPAVVALTSPLPDPTEPLPPIDEEFVTPVHIVNFANLDPEQANVKLERAARASDRPSESERIFALELSHGKLELKVDNLTAFVKELLRRTPQR